MSISHQLQKFAVLAALVAGLSIAGPTQAEDSVKVGVLLSLSGPAAAFGIPERDTIKLLADKHNATVGSAGRKLELVFHDEQTNPTESTRGATKLIQQDKVQVIIGPTIGSSALAIMPIAAANSIPVLTPVATIAVTKEPSFFPWVFRICINDEVLVIAAMEKAIFKAGYKRIAIMFQEDAYGKGSTAFAEKLAKERGIEVVATVGAPANSVDLTAAATKIRNAKPDAVLVWSTGPGMAGAFLRGVAQVGLKVPVIASGALVQRAFIDSAAGAAEGVMLVGVVNWDEPSAKAANLGAILRAGGKTPTGFGELFSASAVVALIEALKKVQGPVTGQKIRDALDSMPNIENPYMDGQFGFSKANHEGFGADAVNTRMVISNGKFKTIQ